MVCLVWHAACALHFPGGGRFGFGGGEAPGGGPRRALAGAGAALLALGPAKASALGKGTPPLSERINAIPAFYVANARGSPYLLNREAEGAQECVIFLEPADAERLLSEMTQASPQLSDARVMCVGLDKALGMLRRKPTPTGNVGRGGKELLLRYRLSPPAAQLGNARSRLGKLFNNKMLPCFVCPELVIKGRTPAFLDLDDLKKAWAAANPSGAAPNVDVHNLLDLVVASEQPAEAGAKGDFDALAFYPAPGAVEYVRKHRRRGNRISRLHAAIA